MLLIKSLNKLKLSIIVKIKQKISFFHKTIS